jgi:flagellar hook-basal body complex protein FliE
MNDLKIDNLVQGLSKTNQSIKPRANQGFGDVISAAVEKVGKLENEADRSIGDLLQGRTDIHETMIALQKSDISMRTFLAVRNKVIEAYREIMRMQF